MPYSSFTRQRTISFSSAHGQFSGSMRLPHSRKNFQSSQHSPGASTAFCTEMIMLPSISSSQVSRSDQSAVGRTMSASWAVGDM